MDSLEGSRGMMIITREGNGTYMAGDIVDDNKPEEPRVSGEGTTIG